MTGNQKHKYKFVYFESKVRARGEYIRMIFHYFGIDFEDVRLSEEEWAHKHKQLKISPMGQLPYLIVDDGKMVLCQSLAIARYLAKSFGKGEGFAGKDMAEAALIDMYADGCSDIVTNFVYTVLPLKDTDKFNNASQEWFKTKYIPFLDMFQEFLKKNEAKNDGHFLVGKQLTWVDFVLPVTIRTFEELHPNSLKNHSHLQDYVTHIRNLPRIKEYNDKNW